MKIKRSILFVICFSLLLLDFSFAQSVKPFKKGDRVVFLGNSITDSGHYHSYIWLFYMTRFPNMPITVINAGVGGDTAAEMYKRLDGDVLSKNPTVIVNTFGMNDSGYEGYNLDDSIQFGNKKYEDCVSNFSKIEKKLKENPKIDIVLMGGSPYDETVKIANNTPFHNKNKAMQRIVKFQKEAANKNRWGFVDLNNPMTKLNEKYQLIDSTFTLSGADRIHPGNDGHMVMAYYFLKGQDLDKHLVSNIEIDAVSNKLINAENCKISKIKRDNLSLTFDYLAKSLPYPMDTTNRYWSSKGTQSDVDKYVPFSNELNREILKVLGLEGKYQLLIDDVVIGEWDSNSFQNGINLANERRTPQYQQALSIMYLNEYRFSIEQKFRSYSWIQYYLFEPKGLLFENGQSSRDLLEESLKDRKWMKGHANNYDQIHRLPVRETWENTMKYVVSEIYRHNKPVKRTIKLIKL